MYPLLLIYFALFTFLVWKDIKWGVFLIVALLPSYLIHFSIGPLPLTVLEGMILITFLLWVWQHCHFDRSDQRERSGEISWRFKRFLDFARNDSGASWLIAIAIFLLAATISVFVSPNLREALGIWKAYFIEPVLFFFVAVDTVKTATDKEKIFWAFSLGALPVAILAVIQHFTGWLIPNPYWAAEATRRVTSVFGYPNAVALYLAPILPFSIYLLIKNLQKLNTCLPTRQVRYFLLLIFLISNILISLFAIVFAQSTGALIALAVTAVLAGLCYKKTRYFSAGLVVLALILIPLTPLKQSLGEEVLLRGRSGQIRLNMWGETVEMLRAHPFLGAGLAGYQTTVAPYHILNWAEIYLYPHNLFLNFWSETGLFGLIGFLWLVVLFFKLEIKKLIGNWKLEIGNSEFTKTEKNITVALLASMIILLIHGLVDVPYFKNDLAVVFWLLLGLI